MTAPLFPARLFGFGEKNFDIERQTLRGGVAISGEQDIVAADGGGRVFVEYSGGNLVDRAANLAWRALQTILDGGATPAIVPLCDARHSAALGTVAETPHSDGASFSDASLYVQGGGATATGAAPLRATSLALTLDPGVTIVGGEWFSVEHAGKGWRAYRVATIAGGVATFRPPLREAVTAGQAIEFAFPRCLMVQDGESGSPLTYGRLGSAAIRFIEAP